MSELSQLALKLATQGPHKTLPSNRLVQILFNKSVVVKTTQAKYIWEHPFYPQFYLPADALDNAQTSHGLKVEPIKDLLTPAGQPIGLQWRLTLRDKSTDQVICFSSHLSGPGAPLAGLVRIPFDAMDQWLEESTPIYVHPKDPFKRIDTLLSTRRVSVSLDGKLLADATTAVHLHETDLPCRYYLPLTSVDTSLLRASATRTKCPYKGEAQYYSVEVGGKVYEDLVWYYTTPTLESSAIAGLLCFYNEKVDISIDGEQQPRPETHFGKGKPNDKPPTE